MASYFELMSIAILIAVVVLFALFHSTPADQPEITVLIATPDIPVNSSVDFVFPQTPTTEVTIITPTMPKPVATQTAQMTQTTQQIQVTPTYWNDTRRTPDGYPNIGGGCCHDNCIPACEFPWWCSE